MGLGGARREWAEYEWFSLADYIDTRPAPGEATPSALIDWLDENPVWAPRQGRRLLLVDLDNLRADPRRWRARMAFVLALAREADDVVLAGQVGAVRRAKPHLAELADTVTSVADGSDLADHVLLDAADALAAGPAQIAVLSNDGIFSSLASRGRLVVISPGADALSDRLVQVADLLVDLAALEAGRVPATATKASAKKAVVKRAVTKQAATKRVATKAATKKAATKKAATKKVATKKKAVTKKAVTKKAVTKKAAKKVVKSTAKKTATKATQRTRKRAAAPA